MSTNQIKYRRSPADGLPGAPAWIAYATGSDRDAATCVLFRHGIGGSAGWAAAAPGLTYLEALEDPRSRWGGRRDHAVESFARAAEVDQ